MTSEVVEMLAPVGSGTSSVSLSVAMAGFEYVRSLLILCGCARCMLW